MEAMGSKGAKIHATEPRADRLATLLRPTQQAPLPPDDDDDDEKAESHSVCRERNDRNRQLHPRPSANPLGSIDDRVRE